MVTKGIIKTLDLTGNTCTVRLPLFETAGNDHIIGTATISNTPGSYNGYKEGDVVWVAFEDGSMNSPVVIGKLYLGVEEERKDPRGVLNVENSTVAKTASMPADTKLSVQTDHNIPNTTSPFGSLSSIANNLNALNTSVAQNDRDYGNKFKQVASEIDNQGNTIRSELSQTADEIKATVTAVEKDLNGKIEKTNSDLSIKADEISAEVTRVETTLDGKIEETKSEFSVKADDITAEVSTKVSSNSNTTAKSFGWNLTSDQWTVYSKTSGNAEAKDVWVDIVQKVVKVAIDSDENQAEGEEPATKDVVKNYYSINGIVTNREVNNESSKPTIEATGDSDTPWAWTDSGELIYKLVDSQEASPLTDIPNIKKILIADEGGLEVRGKIEAERGHIGSFTIGDESNGHSGIYSDDYKDKNGKYITSFKNEGEDWEFSEGAKGVYVGTDGIRLGSNFSVDNEGVVRAKGLRIDLTDEQKNMLSGTTTITYAYHSEGETPPSEGWKEKISELEEDINSKPYFWTKTTTTFAWSDTPKDPEISYTVSKMGSSIKTEVLYKLSTSSSNSEAYKDDWSINVKVPTKAVPYVWTKTRVITNGESVDSTPTLHDSFDNLISILSVDGINIISSTGTGNDKEYHLKADTLSGAVSDQVTIGGFTIGEHTLTAGTGSGAFTIQTTSDLLNYTPADYIESNGSQYIDTGVVMNYATDTFEIVVQPTVTAQNGMIFGRWNNAENEAALYHYNDSGDIRFYAYGSHGSQQNIPSGILTSDLSIHTYRVENSELFVDSKESVGKLNYTVPVSAFTSYIFAANGLASHGYKGKIYSCKIWRSGTLIRNFKPALKDNEYCLYDACTGEFYKNLGTGRFTGSLNSEKASYFELNGTRYTRLDYIENNGINNYIDPKISFDYEKDFIVEAEFMQLENTTKDHRYCILSSYNSKNPALTLEGYWWEEDSTNRLWVGLNRNLSDPKVNTVYGTLLVNSKNNIKVSYTPQFDANGVRNSFKIAVKVNSYSSTDTISGALVNATQSPYIFTDNSRNFSTLSIPIRLYSMKIYYDDNIIANLIPVMNESTQTPGLINLVTGEFLPNAAGDKFKYGEYTTGGLVFNGRDGDTNSYRVLEYIENTGAQYIDTGVAPTTNMTSEISFTFLEGSSEHAIFGSTWANDGYFLMAHEDKLKWHSKGKAGYAASLSPGNTYVCKCGPDYFEVNGKQYNIEVVNSETEADSTDPIKLLSSLGYTNADGIIKCRIKSFKLWKGTELVKDFIPVIKEESEYGLYDIVEGNFYSNRGTGNFTGKGFAQEFTALYLGAPDPESAPFSVTNTGKMKAVSGNIGGFRLSDNVLESGTRGTANNILVASSGQTAEIGNSWGDDWLFTIGKSFGVDSSGKISVSNGTINGTLSSTECYLQNVKEFNFIGDSLRIGGMQLTNELLDISTVVTGKENFILTSGRSSFIGSNSLYSLEFNCSKSAYETTDLGWTVVSSSWSGNKNGYPVYNTIEFNQPLVLLKGNDSIKISAVGNDRGMYGSWTFEFITLKNPTSGETKTLRRDEYFEATLKTTAETPTPLLTCSGGFIPTSDGGGTLGRAGQSWGNIYGKNIYADGDVQFKLNDKSYSPVVRLTNANSPNCFWSATLTINSNRWKSIQLPEDIRGKVIAAVVSSCDTKPSDNPETDGTGIKGDRPSYDFSSLEQKGVDKKIIPDLQTGIASGMIANCLYVDYSSSDDYVWVFNGQKEPAKINLIVAANIS